MGTLRTKRIYDPAAPEDGVRVLVDRLWPRGLTKAEAAIDHWAKDIAPSTDLRKWVHADMEARWPAFEARYRAELAPQTEALRALVALAGDRSLTLLYSVKDPERNHAVILRQVLEALGPD
ncbi:DUF488 domain-containing protein [Pedomonas sp. V897]|uniref:DUF488 domain-containing protein n=1 Tax=Pedomonas sp. V897 TaxID=3446482 RepID=UPI003EE24904